MFRSLLFLLPVFLQAGLFDWFDALSPQARWAKERMEEFDPIIEKALADYGVPGLAVGVVVDGHVVYMKGFGYRDLERKLPVTKETLFATGSCTKSFTAFAMGNLVDEGWIGWDQPIIDLLPEFRLSDQYATSNLTVRDLLTHRSGMPRHEFLWYNSKMNRAEMLRRIRHLPLSYDLRERYQYGNLMYFTAGLAMEQVTGKTWEEIVQQRILTPLEMVRTNFSVEETEKSDNYAVPYLERNDRLRKMPLRNLSLIAPAGAINSNLEEMLRWVQLQLDGGIYKGQTLISPATLQELHAPQVVVPGPPETEESKVQVYGIGWIVVPWRGHYFVSHDGVSDGFTSVIGFVPRREKGGIEVGVAVFANKNMTVLPRYLSLDIIDCLFQLSFKDWVQEGLNNFRNQKRAERGAREREDRSRKKGTLPSHSLEEYVGVYEHPGYGKLTIELVDGKLEMNYNDLLFVLDHWHYDVFNVAQEKQDMVASFEGKKLTFCNSPSGEIGEVLVPFEPTTDDIVFKKQPADNYAALSYLRRFTGPYELYGYKVEVVVRNNVLVAIIPGQPNYELTPAGDNEFTIRMMTGSSVRFMMNQQDRVEKVHLNHPYGTFTAIPIQS